MSEIVTYFLGKAEEDQLGQTRSSSEWRRNTLICLCWIDLPRRPHHAVSLCGDGAWYYIVAAQYKYCTLRTTESRQIIASHSKIPFELEQSNSNLLAMGQTNTSLLQGTTIRPFSCSLLPSYSHCSFPQKRWP